jgi:predicted type IV restriction endonuclease
MSVHGITISSISKIKKMTWNTIARWIKDLMIHVDDQQSTKTDSALDISEYMSRKQQDNEKIETTEEEVRAFRELLNILYGHVDSKRIVWRDVVTYFGVLLDDNNRKPICRFHFNTSKKYISLFDSPDRSEEKVQISSIDEIKNFAGRLLNTVKSYS